MFSEKKSSGKHLICDVKGIKNIRLLNSMVHLTEMLNNICDVCEFGILKRIMHEFKPIGCSVLFLLSESHISIHTFPEQNHLSFDLYTCRQYETNEDYKTIVNYLITELEAAPDTTYKIIDRYF